MKTTLGVLTSALCLLACSPSDEASLSHSQAAGAAGGENLTLHVGAASPSPAAPPLTAGTAVTITPSPDLLHGEKIYRQACAFCHDRGVTGAPKIGDTAGWSPRLAQGMDTLYAVALHGKGAMPARGGNPGLNETDTRAAVDFLTARSRP